MRWIPLWKFHSLIIKTETWTDIFSTRYPQIFQKTFWVCVLCTWLASSLVGEMITALKPWLAGCCKWASSGRQKAKVFPDPVGAQARSSRPWSRDQTHRHPYKTAVCTLFTNRSMFVCVHSHASWAVSPASALASGNRGLPLWGSGGHVGWVDTRTVALQMCKQGQVCRSHAHLYGVESEYDSPKSNKMDGFFSFTF